MFSEAGKSLKDMIGNDSRVLDFVYILEVIWKERFW